MTADVASMYSRLFRILTRLVVLLGYGWASVVLSFAQAAGQPNHSVFRGVELGGDYNYASQCGCFSPHGTDAWFAIGLPHSFAVVTQAGEQGASNIHGSGENLNLASFLIGPRYRAPKFLHIAPFGQVLLGGVRVSGSAASYGFPGSTHAFALITSAGLDVAIARHFAVRPFEADYYFTDFTQPVNEPQRYLLLGGGVFFRFGER